MRPLEVATRKRSSPQQQLAPQQRWKYSPLSRAMLPLLRWLPLAASMQALVVVPWACFEVSLIRSPRCHHRAVETKVPKTALTTASSGVGLSAVLS